MYVENNELLQSAKSFWRPITAKYSFILSAIKKELYFYYIDILYFSILLHSLTLNICSFVRQCNTFTS
jgi:hypothetical protein